MSSIRTRLSKLERRVISPSPPVSRSTILPELRALFAELSPLMEESEVLRKLLEEARVGRPTRQNRIAFWATLRELLVPHPALYHRLVALLTRQIQANESAAAKQAVGEQPIAPAG
jgi:hypothetical protein